MDIAFRIPKDGLPPEGRSTWIRYMLLNGALAMTFALIGVVLSEKDQEVATPGIAACTFTSLFLAGLTLIALFRYWYLVLRWERRR
jgi:hypothetical protein